MDERPLPVLAATGVTVIDDWIGFVNGGARPGVPPELATPVPHGAVLSMPTNPEAGG